MGGSERNAEPDNVPEAVEMGLNVVSVSSSSTEVS